MTSRPEPDRSQEPLAQRIREAFEILRLKHTAQQFEEALANPAPDLSRLDWLWSLLEPQVRQRIEARIERRIRESRLPERKTMAEFHFEFQPKLDKDLVLELDTLAFLDKGRNVLLAGWSGTGKSHIAMALGTSGCVANRRVRYTTSADLLAILNASRVDNTLNKALKAYTRPELLIIDEVGLEQVEKAEAARAGLVQKVLLPRHNDQRSTIITSNIPWDGWGSYLGDQLGANAILDRLIQRSHVIVIEGPSWRAHLHEQELAARQAEKAQAAPTDDARPRGEEAKPARRKKEKT